MGREGGRDSTGCSSGNLHWEEWQAVLHGQLPESSTTWAQSCQGKEFGWRQRPSTLESSRSPLPIPDSKWLHSHTDTLSTQVYIRLVRHPCECVHKTEA